MHTAPDGVFLSTISVLATLFGWKFASPVSQDPKAMPKTKDPARRALVTPPISSPHQELETAEVLAPPPPPSFLIREEEEKEGRKIRRCQREDGTGLLKRVAVHESGAAARGGHDDANRFTHLYPSPPS